MKQNKEIPAGYKDSPLGIIPEEWEVKKLDELGTFLKGKGIPKDKIKSFGNPCLTYGDIYTKYNFVVKDIKSFIDDSTALESQKIEFGDILFAGSGETIEDIGKCVAYIDKEIAYAGGDIIILKPYKAESITLSYILNSSVSNKQKYKFGQGHSIVHIYPFHLKKIEIALPTLPEQKKIAEILFFWDKAIEKQERLVEKLERRKRGLMQQLLTARIRISGFSGSWQTIKMGDVFKRITRKNTELNDNVVTISAQRGFIKQTDFFNKTIASKIIDNYFLIKKGEFCYNKSYSKGYPMGVVKLLSDFDKAVVTTLYICFALKTSDNSVDFFKYYFDSGSLNQELTKIANEGGRAHGLLNVTPSDFFDIHIRIPKPEERLAISEILSSMDKLIEFERKKLQMICIQRGNLMQLLLTGKTRVNI